MSRFTPERTATAAEIIGRYPVARSALIPLLHLAQEQDGYVTPDAMEQIAELVGCTPAEVYGTGSFYEMFKFEPVGTYVVGVCTNISCLLLGAEELLEHCKRSLGVPVGGTTADGAFTLEEVECIAACTVAPCVQVNYRYFPSQTPESVDQLFADLRAGRLHEEVPPHGTLARTRQHVEPSRWAGSGAAPPRTAEAAPGPALAAPGPGPALAGTHAEPQDLPESASQPDPGDRS
jgi:NADH-quinone oxidoreductase subunit E